MLTEENVIPLRRKKNKEQKINFTLRNVHPLTHTQKTLFRDYATGKNIMAHGFPGTGKSFLLIYLALNQILRENSPYKKLVIIRSAVPTRDVGFLPGKLGERTKVYEAAYYAILTELFGRGDAYDYLKNKGVIEFMTTSYIRAITIHDSIVLVDEMQNATYHELDSCMTRIGENCKILFAGDFRQSDFTYHRHKAGLHNFMAIIKNMGAFHFIDFQKEDIVRSELVKEYIITKERLYESA